ncbi:MAG: hypothetical protein KatS3mg111_2812 [Pirellulaceae bacterium]|nr:MAG: hypothetical protein KatS3mg111_2812 [Pirellulaceae bacterium]
MWGKRKLVILGGVLTAAALFAGVWSFYATSDPHTHELDLAIKFLEEGRVDVAVRLAHDLEAHIDPDANAKWHYLTAASALRSIENELGTPHARRVVTKALAHLEKARQIGFPPGYRVEGRYYLGYCYFLLNRWQEAIDELSGLAEQWPEKRSDIWRLMVRSYLRLAPPDFESASRELASWSRVPGLSREEQAANLLERAVLEFSRQHYAAAEQILTSIPDDTRVRPEAELWRARLRLAEALLEMPQTPLPDSPSLVEATEILRKLRSAASTPEDIRRHAMFLYGRCLRLQGNSQEAMGVLSSLRQIAPRSVEAIAAGLEEAEILLNTDSYSHAVEILHSLLINLEDIGLYDDFWLPRKTLKKRLIDIGRGLAELGDFGLALQHAQNLAIAFPLADSLQLQGEILQRWAEALASQPPPQGMPREQYRQLVTQKFLRAAETYEQWTLIEWAAPNYNENLWNAITNYERANDLQRANELLRRYLQYEDRTKRPRALLALGSNLMSEGKWTQALEPLNRCLIEYPEHPVSYDARLMAARTHAEMGDLAEAIELLEENLYDHQLHPSNTTWQQSLLELGKMLYQSGERLVLEARLHPAQDKETERKSLEESQQRFLEAVYRLTEASRRWETGHAHYYARHLLALSYRQAAEIEQLLMQAQPEQSLHARRKSLQSRRDLLDQALEHYRALSKDLVKNLTSLDNADWAQKLLCSAYFGVADALFDQARWEEAIDAYQNITARFLNEPESLEALVQIAACYDRLGRAREAKHVLATAKQVLARIPNTMNERFAQVTRGSRNDWERLINEMEDWY